LKIIYEVLAEANWVLLLASEQLPMELSRLSMLLAENTDDHVNE